MIRVPAFARRPLLAMVRNGESRLAGRLRQRAYGTVCYIDTSVFITDPDNFVASDGCALYHGTCVLNTHGRLILGPGSHLGAGCYVNAHYGTVVLGSDVAVGPGTQLIAYSNHYGRGRKITETRVTADIHVGNNVFIGANCTILPGASIGDNVVVAAGAVVKGALAEEGIYGGMPARRIGDAWY